MGAGVSVIPQWAGFIACALAVICFSLANVPVKKFDTGDGFFFQFVYCSCAPSTWPSLLFSRAIRIFVPV